MPVFQAAHMLTHVASDAIDGIVQVDVHLEDSEAETDSRVGYRQNLSGLPGFNSIQCCPPRSAGLPF